MLLSFPRVYHRINEQTLFKRYLSTNLDGLSAKKLILTPGMWYRNNFLILISPLIFYLIES